MEFAEQALADSNWNRYHLVRRIRIFRDAEIYGMRSEKDKSVEIILKSLKLFEGVGSKKGIAHALERARQYLSL